MAKRRADELLFELGLAESREQAKRLIMAGLVEWQGPDGRVQPVPKPGHPYPEDARLLLKQKERFVSRGAYKLLTALEHFQLEVQGFACLDAGASTGGFTDCLLQHGAARVYAVDVGQAQLHEKLLADTRVISLEKCNLRTAPEDLIPEPLDLVVADVSFISLTLILPVCLRWLKPGGLCAALIKPQFEVGPGQTHKGVVRDEAVRLAAVNKVLNFVGGLDMELLGQVPAAIKGPKGNQEYMAVWRKQDEKT